LSETPRQAPRTPSPPAQEEYSRTPSLPPSAPSTPLPAPAPPPLPDDSSLLAKITPSTPPQRAASLRLTDEGRKLLEAGDASRALGRLEKTIAIDSSNPYGYYYLAKAQHALGRNQESLRFLDVAEPLFGNNPYWLAEVFALRGENYRALGSYERAETNYTQALRFNPGNKVAADGLARVQNENGPAQR
jgi:tetratricopeptide (TPR) repeat protein